MQCSNAGSSRLESFKSILGHVPSRFSWVGMTRVELATKWNGGYRITASQGDFTEVYEYDVEGELLSTRASEAHYYFGRTGYGARAGRFERPLPPPAPERGDQFLMGIAQSLATQQ
jgi:hypothetical protein